MNNLTSFQGKMVYLVGILVLMVPIFLLGSTEAGVGARARPRPAAAGLQARRIEPRQGRSRQFHLQRGPARFPRGRGPSVLWRQAEEQKATRNFAELAQIVESISPSSRTSTRVWQYRHGTSPSTSPPSATT